LGWTVIRLEQQQEPQQSFRTHFGQVVLQLKLEEALRIPQVEWAKEWLRRNGEVLEIDF
jgi:hypothetical protein